MSYEESIPLEGPDERISLIRAGALSGRTSETLRVQAAQGRIRTVKVGRDYRTTRRWLHDYLLAAAQEEKGRFLRLPPDYVAPE